MEDLTRLIISHERIEKIKNKNLELSKLTLLNQTPIINIIDILIVMNIILDN